MNHSATAGRRVITALALVAVITCLVVAVQAPWAHAAGSSPVVQGCDTPGSGDTGSEEASVDKPAIVSIEIDRENSGNVQPAAGGTFAWIVTFAEGSDLALVEDDDFTIQRMPWKKEWKNSKCPVPLFEKISANKGRFYAMAIPDNKAGQNLWRFLYLGQDLKCPIIVQYSYEGKHELLKAIDAAEKELAATPVSADGADLEKGTLYVTQQVASAFQKAIDDAQAVCDDESVTQSTTDAAVVAVNAAKETFGAAKKAAVDTVTPAKDDPAKDDPAKRMGADGTALGRGASAQAAEAAIVACASDEGPAGSTFGVLKLCSTKQAKGSITLKWTKAKGAKSYVVYAGKSGAKGMARVATTGKTSLTLKKAAGKQLKKGTYYKAMVVALDAKDSVVTASKVVHVATKGGKKGNPAKVTTKAKKGKLALKRGKAFKLGAKQVLPKGVKAAKRRALSYETSDAKVATVSKSGKVKAKAKGSCTVYAYAQNGVYAKVKVTVK